MAVPNLCACEYVVIRLAPDPVRDERINIGVALYEAGNGRFAGVRLNPDLRRARQLSPAFEEADLAGLEQDLLQRLERAPDSPAAKAAPWAGREYFLQLAAETFSHALQLTAPTAVLTADPAAELDRLYREYAASPASAGTTLVDAGRRRRILQHLNQVFAAERVLARLQRNLRAATLLGRPDSLRFDYHYQIGNDHCLIQAVPLSEDEGAVKALCFTLDHLRHRLPTLDVAVFHDAPPLPRRPPGVAGVSSPESDGESNDAFEYQVEMLVQAGVRRLTLEDAPAEAARIRAALHIA